MTTCRPVRRTWLLFLALVILFFIAQIMIQTPQGKNKNTNSNNQDNDNDNHNGDSGNDNHDNGNDNHHRPRRGSRVGNSASNSLPPVVSSTPRKIHADAQAGDTQGSGHNVWVEIPNGHSKDIMNSTLNGTSNLPSNPPLEVVENHVVDDERCPASDFQNGHFVGSDIAARVVTGHPQCCSFCHDHPWCVAWTSDGHMCYLKDWAPSLSKNTGKQKFVSGTVQERAPGLTCFAEHEKKSLEHITFNDSSCSSSTGKPIRRNVILAGLAYKTTDESAAKLVKALEQLGKWFCDYRVVIYENEPKSFKALQLAEENPRFHVTYEKLQLPSAWDASQKTSCGREKTLVHLRNRLLAIIQHRIQNSLLQAMDPFKTDYVILMDLDMVISGGIDSNKVGPQLCKRLQSYSGWDVICAFGHHGGKHYDSYALSPCETEYYNKIHSFPMTQNYASTLQEYIHPGKPDMIRVRSCFGALAVYRADALTHSGCIYDEHKNTCLCEHVPFNTCLFHQNFSGIYLDQALETDYRLNGGH